MNPLKKNKKILIFVIVMMFYSVFITSSTYAYLNIQAQKNNMSGVGGCFEVSYQGTRIDSTDPLYTTIDGYEGGRSSVVTLSKASGCDIYTSANIYIHTNNSTTAPLDTTPAIRYRLVGNGSFERTGFVNQKGNVLLANVPLTQTATNYTIYLWIDAELSSGLYNDKVYSGYIYATAAQTSTIAN